MLRQAKFFLQEMLGAAHMMRGSNAPAQSAPELLQLETRILMSATPLAAEPAPNAEADVAPIAEADDPDVNQEQALEVVVIDGNVADADLLLADLEAQQASGRALEILVLDTDRDGVDQIGNLLDGLTDVGALHIISHSENGAVRLGNTWLGADALSGYAGQIANWGNALALDADILFYGCDLASNAEGQGFLEDIASLTNADVAASIDDTGHAQFQADWDLEFATGVIDTSVAVSQAAQDSWHGKLATFTVTTYNDVVDGGDGVLSLREAIDMSNAGAGGDTILLGPGTYVLSITGSSEDSNATGDLDINQAVTITGDGADTTFIDSGSLSDRTIEVRLGTATITGVTLQDAISNIGGAIYSQSGTTTIIKDAEFVNNNATARGGAIYVDGGGLNLERVTIANNAATNEGGGLYFDNGGTGQLTNVTISGNSASSGGGLFNHSSTVTLTNVTIANNSTGIGTQTPIATQLKNTILSNIGFNSNSALTSMGNNIDDDFSAFLGDPLDGQNPNLAPLGNYGGPTRTHALQDGSVAIDAGTASGAPNNDQRTVGRISGTDIGAFEYVTNHIHQTAASITIDGTIDGAWSSADTNGINTLILGAVDNPTDLSGSWRALWDSTYLYVLVEVSDESLQNDSGSTWWEDDTVEIFIDPDYSHDTTYDGVNDYQLGLRVFDSTVHPGLNSQTNTSGILSTVLTSTGSYVAEVAVPWALLGGPPLSYTGIGFEVQINDDDDGGGRDGKLAWYGVDDQASVNPSAFGISQLSTFSNAAPTAVPGGPYTTAEGLGISLDGSGSFDSDGTIVSYEWDLLNNGSFEKSGANVSFSWLEMNSAGIVDDGSHNVALRVTDNLGAQTTQVFQIAVDNTAPTLTISGDDYVVAGQTYTLNLGSADPGMDLISDWTIDWGDGQIDTIAGNPTTVTHTYSNTGHTNNIVVSAEDEDGTHTMSELVVGSLAGNKIFFFDGNDASVLAQPASPGSPVDVVLGPDGLLYVSGFSDNSIRRFDPTTYSPVDTFVSGGTSLNNASRMAFGPDGNLYVTSFSSDQVIRFDGVDGSEIDIFIGGPGAGGLSGPDGITFGPNGKIYVASTTTSQILEYNSDGSFSRIFANVGSTGYTDLKFATNGNLYVSNLTLNSVQEFHGTSGTKLGDIVSPGEGGINGAADFTWGPDGNLYVTGFTGNHVMRYDAAGAHVDTFITSGAGLNQPVNLVFTAQKQVTVTTDPTIALTPIADTYLSNFTQDDNYGTAATLIVDRSGGDQGDQRPLLEFDLSSIPVGAAITHAELRLQASQNNGAFNVNVYQMLEAWEEGTENGNPDAANWDDRSNSSGTSNWTNTGGTFDGTSVASLNSGLLGTHAWDITGLAQSWFASPSTNHGLLLGSTDGGSTTISYHSRESSSPPELVVSYFVNDPPTADPGGPYNVNEGSSILLDGSLSSDSDGTIAQYEWDLSFDGITFNSEVTGATTNFDASSIDGSTFRQVALRVTDNLGAQSPVAAVTVNVLNVNPTITSSLTPSIPENTTFVQTLTATDPMDPVSFSLTGGVDRPLFNLSGTSLSFVSAPDFEAPGGNIFEVEVTADDGDGGQDVQTITVQVTDVNEPPTAVDDAAFTNAGSPVVIDVVDNDIDPEMDSLIVLDTTSAANGEITDNGDGTLTYMPKPAYSGPDSFDYIVTDGQGGLTHFWNLNGHADDVVGGADGTLNGGISGSEGVYGLGMLHDELDDHIVLPDVTYSDQFTVTFKFKIDEAAGSEYQYIYSHGDHSVVNSLNVFLGEDSKSGFAGTMKTVFGDNNDAYDLNALNFDASAVVGDGFWHTYALTVDNVNGAQVYLDGVLRASDASRGGDAFDPSMNLMLGARHDLDPLRFFGGRLDSVAIFDHSLSSGEVAALNAAGLTTPRTSAATVNVNTNALPTADAGGPYTVPEGSSITLDGSASNDTDGSITLYEWDFDYNGSFDLAATGVAPNFSASSLDGPSSKTVALRVTDNHGAVSSIVTATVNISNVNPAMIADGGVGFSTDEDTVFTTGNVLDNDSDVPGDPLTVTGINTTSTFGLVTDNGDGTFDYDPNGQFDALAVGQSVTDTFVYSISDGDGGSSSTSVTVQVNGANDIPTIDPGQRLVVSEAASNGFSLGFVTATELDAIDSLTNWQLIGGNTGGVFALDNTSGELTVVNNAGLDHETQSSYNLLVTVSDGSSTSSPGVIRVDVSNVNDTAPIAVSDSYSLNEGAAANVQTTPSWFNANWSGRQRLDIDSIEISNPLSNFPVLVKLHASASDAIQIDYSKLQNAGEDLRFVDSNGAILSHQIEKWDKSGYSYVWVNIPQVDAATDSDFFWMYYGNSSVVDAQAPSSVWNANELAILHMNGNALDSSANGQHGVVSASFVNDGIVAKAAFFDGSNDDINLGSDASIDDIFATGGTISTWIKPASWGQTGFGRIADKSDQTFLTSGNGWALQVQGVGGLGSVRFEHAFDVSFGSWSTSLGTLALDDWQHIVFSYDSSSSSNVPEIFINGESKAVSTNNTPVGFASSDAALDLKIGNHSNALTRTFDGKIDEFRIFDDLRTPDEVLASYKAVTGTLLSSAGELSGPGGLLDNDSDPDHGVISVTLVSGPAHAASFNLNADGSFDYQHDGGESSSDSFVYRVHDGLHTADATVALTINAVNDLAVGKPVILGKAQVGNTLTTDTSGITDAEGVGTLNFQWFRDGVAITDATSDEYTLIVADVGTAITVQVTYVDGDGNAEGPISSDATADIDDAPPAPARSTAATTASSASSEPEPDSEPEPEDEPVVDEETETEETIAAPSAPAPTSDEAAEAEGELLVIANGLPGSQTSNEKGATSESKRTADGNEESGMRRRLELNRPGTLSTSLESAVEYVSASFDFLSDTGELWNDLDSFQDSIQSNMSFENVVIGSFSAMTSSITAGYVIWMVRGGVVASTLLAQLPAWKYMDAMVVIAGVEETDIEDDDSLESIVDKGIDEYQSAKDFIRGK